MSNIAGKAYAMNVLTPMRPWKTWIQVLIFMVARATPQQLGGLLGLRLIHFARWVIIRRDQWPDRGQGEQTLTCDYMLFLSNFNGTWDQYIDAFADGIPVASTCFWYASIKYPHSIPISTFKDYIGANQIQTNYLLQRHSRVRAARHQGSPARARGAPCTAGGARAGRCRSLRERLSRCVRAAREFAGRAGNGAHGFRRDHEGGRLQARLYRVAGPGKGAR